MNHLSNASGMEYPNYVSQISFRFLQPDQQRQTLQRVHNSRVSRWWLHRLGLSLEVANTRLPQDGPAMRRRLHDLLSIPRMSTFAIGAMISRAVSEMPADECFVNVGVWNGFTLLSGMAGNADKRCIGVDNFSEFGGPREQFLERFRAHASDRHSFYDVDYRDYFSTIHREAIGFYIYDGEHSYENQLEGLRVAELYFSPTCLVLVDDTNWDEPRQATLDFIAESKNRYRMLLDRTTASNSHPTFHNGIMVFQRVG